MVVAPGRRWPASDFPDGTPPGLADSLPRIGNASTHGIRGSITQHAPSSGRSPVNRFAHIVAAASLASVALCHAASAAEPRPVLAQDLSELTVAGKVSAVLWTRRPDSWTVQVVLPRHRPIAAASRVAQPASPATTPPEKPPRIEVWLLRADGSRIAAAYRWETPQPKDCLRCIGSDVLYAFRLAEGDGAASVAISVDDEYRSQRLRPFVE